MYVHTCVHTCILACIYLCATHNVIYIRACFFEAYTSFCVLQSWVTIAIVTGTNSYNVTLTLSYYCLGISTGSQWYGLFNTCEVKMSLLGQCQWERHFKSEACSVWKLSSLPMCGCSCFLTASPFLILLCPSKPCRLLITNGSIGEVPNNYIWAYVLCEWSSCVWSHPLMRILVETDSGPERACTATIGSNLYWFPANALCFVC